MRALNSAATGMQAQQTALDVIGNNIANVNTYGFKSSRTDFSDLFYQTLEGGTSNTDAEQVGYGARVSGTSKDMSAAGQTSTGYAYDLYINGGGYFITSNDYGSHTAGSSTSNDTNNKTTVSDAYTRVGNFKFNSQGYMIDKSSGNYVMGLDSTTLSSATPTLHAISLVGATFHPSTGTGSDVAILSSDSTATENSTQVKFGSSAITDVTINLDGTISAKINGVEGTFEYGTSNGAGGDAADPIIVGIATFPNDEGLTQVGDNSFTSSVSSGVANYAQASNGNTTKLISGALEQSNVDLAKEFSNMIVTQRGFQANSRVITVADSLLEEIVNLKRS